VAGVSVIVPLFNRWDLTAQCIAALNRCGDPVELVLVDNGSSDETAAQRVQVRNDRNRGFAVACNQGAQYASGDVLVFLNNDTEPQQGWLAPLVAGLDEATISGARLTYPSGQLQHTGVAVDFSQPPGQEAWGLTDERESGFVPAVTGACLAIRRAEFMHLGGFDDGFWNGYEDVDLCLRAGRCWYAAESVVVHHESQSGPERWRAVRENIYRLRAKWGAM
jgi:GT2 family glycosyltransferase